MFAKKIVRNVAHFDTLLNPRSWRGRRNDSLLSAGTTERNPGMLGVAWTGDPKYSPLFDRVQLMFNAVPDAVRKEMLAQLGGSKSGALGATTGDRAVSTRNRDWNRFGRTTTAADLQRINEASRSGTTDRAHTFPEPQPTRSGSAWLHKQRTDTRSALEQMQAEGRKLWG